MEYILERKKIKNMYIKVKNDKVIISVPYHYPTAVIQQFVEAKQAWIQAAIQKQHQHQNKYTITDQVRIFGAWYMIQISDRFQLDGNILMIPDEQTLKKYLRSILENEAKKHFDKYCDLMQQYFDIPQLKFSYLKGKWGVCFTKKAVIGLSYHLVHCSKAFIEYVVIHELAHLVHPNHSKQFYYFIEKYMPHYKQVILDEKNAH